LPGSNADFAIGGRVILAAALANEKTGGKTSTAFERPAWERRACRLENRRYTRPMRLRLFIACLIALVCWSPGSSNAADSAPAGQKIRVLVVTGGHDFEKPQFYKIFEDNPEITFKAVEHPNAHKFLRSDLAKEVDVYLYYDMYQPISDEAKADYLARLKEGKGMVVMHHAIASYQKWPEYSKVIGARYYLEKTTVDGVEKARSAYQHDVNFKVRIEDPSHPVTRGVTDFEIHDETYKLFDVADTCEALLTTDEPLSNKVIGWAKTYEASRIVYLQCGHDHFAYENPNFRKIVAQAIRWTAKKD
jgi:uncharacterized protein